MPLGAALVAPTASSSCVEPHERRLQAEGHRGGALAHRFRMGPARRRRRPSRRPLALAFRPAFSTPLRQGDVLVVWKLDRLGLNLAHPVNTRARPVGPRGGPARNGSRNAAGETVATSVEAMLSEAVVGGTGRILSLPRSGQLQPERPRGADPGVTPWYHALDQKRVVRSGVAQVLFTIFALIQTVLWSRLKCIFNSNLTFKGRDIRVARNVVFGSSRWLPRIGSASSDEIGGAWHLGARHLDVDGSENPPRPCRRPALVVELGGRQP